MAPHGPRQPAERRFSTVLVTPDRPANEVADSARSGERGGRDSERGDEPKLAAPFIPPVWYRARLWDPPITSDAAYF
ncbi:hypothetical protein Acsp01_15510 [Actinoplanes sp. NBRC 101535]|nr:hypothetical protein Acsp01_15510 [Actinoplanes sp. NBRC 101535]